FRAFDRWVEQISGDVPYVIKEAAILFESGSYKLCDKSVIVTAPLEARLERVMHRDNITHEEAAKRDARQMPEEEKLKLADYAVNNDGTQLLIPQVVALHQTILSQVKN
ncbi:MAG: dephospho-CoA kinase, partial [Sphingobacteriaceae bacterium]